MSEKLQQRIENLVWLFRWTRAGRAASRGVVAGLIWLLVVLLLDRTHVIQLERWWLLPAALIPLAAAAAALLWPVNYRQIISLADRNTGLDQRLITTYEYLHAGRESPFLDLLQADLDQALDTAQRRHPFPVAWWRDVPIAGLTVMLLGGAALWDGLPVSPADPPVTVEQREERLESLRDELTREMLAADRSRYLDALEDEAESRPDLTDEDTQRSLSTQYEDLRDRLRREMDREWESLQRRLEHAEAESFGLSTDEEAGDDRLDPEEGYRALRPSDEQGDPVDDGLDLPGEPGDSPGRADLGDDWDEWDDEDEDYYGDHISTPGDFPDLEDYQERDTPDFDSPDYEPGQVPAEVREEIYISVYFEEFLPPDPEGATLDLDERLLSYRTELLNRLAGERIPAGQRDLVRDYFSLLTLE